MALSGKRIVQTSSDIIEAPTSTVLRDLLAHDSGETVTLGYLVGKLGHRSFGIVLLILGLLAILPGVSAIVGVIIPIPAYQMMRARRYPVFPRVLASKSFRKRRLASVVNHAVPLLRYLEKYIRPRWQTPFETTKRVVGVAIFLTGTLLFVPVPFSNFLPALMIILLAFAFLEEDGVALLIALAVTLALLLVAAGLIWQAMSTAGWVPSFL
jgi:hypothetical protein